MKTKLSPRELLCKVLHDENIDAKNGKNHNKSYCEKKHGQNSCWYERPWNERPWYERPWNERPWYEKG